MPSAEGPVLGTGDAAKDDHRPAGERRRGGRRFAGSRRLGRRSLGVRATVEGVAHSQDEARSTSTAPLVSGSKAGQASTERLPSAMFTPVTSSPIETTSLGTGQSPTQSAPPDPAESNSNATTSPSDSLKDHPLLITRYSSSITVFYDAPGDAFFAPATIPTTRRALMTRATGAREGEKRGWVRSDPAPRQRGRLLCRPYCTVTCRLTTGS